VYPQDPSVVVFSVAFAEDWGNVSGTPKRHGLIETGFSGPSWIDVDGVSTDPSWAAVEEDKTDSWEATGACAWPRACVIAIEIVMSKT
jgi:hypothetical protein